MKILFNITMCALIWASVLLLTNDGSILLIMPLSILAYALQRKISYDEYMAKRNMEYKPLTKLNQAEDKIKNRRKGI